MPYSKPCPPCPRNPEAVWPSPLLNFVGPGEPMILCPERVNSNASGDRLPPVVPANTRDFPIVYRTDPTWDFYADYVTVVLYNTTSGIVYTPKDVNAGTADTADVRFRFFDGAREASWSDENIHWQQIAGSGRLPYKFEVPLHLAAGNTYTVYVSNNETGDSYMVGLYFHGRRVRAKRGRDGRRVVDAVDIQAAKKIKRLTAERGNRIPILCGDNNVNKLKVGVPHFKSLANVATGNPPVLNTGTVAAPGRNTFNLRVDAASQFYVTALHATVALPGGANPNENLVNAQFEIQEPVFIRIFDEKNEYFLMNRHVPLNACTGDGKFPYYLPQDWVWPQAADVTLEVLNPTANAYQLHFAFDGYKRTAGEPC